MGNAEKNRRIGPPVCRSCGQSDGSRYRDRKFYYLGESEEFEQFFKTLILLQCETSAQYCIPIHCAALAHREARRKPLAHHDAAKALGSTVRRHAVPMDPIMPRSTARRGGGKIRTSLRVRCQLVVLKGLRVVPRATGLLPMCNLHRAHVGIFSPYIETFQRGRDTPFRFRHRECSTKLDSRWAAWYGAPIDGEQVRTLMADTRSFLQKVPVST